MTIAELHAELTKAIEAGHANARVLFDAEARTFHVHYVAIDSACLEADQTVADTMGGPFLGLYTRYHETDEEGNIL